jgi:hypothetical protein
MRPYPGAAGTGAVLPIITLPGTKGAQPRLYTYGPKHSDCEAGYSSSAAAPLPAVAAPRGGHAVDWGPTARWATGPSIRSWDVKLSNGANRVITRFITPFKPRQLEDRRRARRLRPIPQPVQEAEGALAQGLAPGEGSTGDRKRRHLPGQLVYGATDSAGVQMTGELLPSHLEQWVTDQQAHRRERRYRRCRAAIKPRLGLSSRPPDSAYRRRAGRAWTSTRSAGLARRLRGALLQGEVACSALEAAVYPRYSPRRSWR